MLKSKKISCSKYGAQTYSIYYSLDKNLLSLAGSFSMEKLLAAAACTTERGKAGANALKSTSGVNDFFFF